MYKCLFLIIMLLFYSKINAQHVLNGFLKDSLTHFAIRGAKVYSRATKQPVYSNSKGLFSIAVKSNDTISISLEGYESRTIHYSPLFNDTIVLYLSSLLKMLPTVSVSSRYDQYQLDSIGRRRDFEQMRGGRLNSVSAAPGFGIAINLDRIFKKRYKNQKKNEERFNLREKEAYITYRYSPQLVAYYTGLKGEDLQNFLNQHTPSYEWLRKHPADEQVFYNINEHLKLFQNKNRK